MSCRSFCESDAQSGAVEKRGTITPRSAAVPGRVGCPSLPTCVSPCCGIQLSAAAHSAAAQSCVNFPGRELTAERIASDSSCASGVPWIPAHLSLSFREPEKTKAGPQAKHEALNSRCLLGTAASLTFTLFSKFFSELRCFIHLSSDNYPSVMQVSFQFTLQINPNNIFILTNE